jgi:pyroglutamyl-peptidase
MKHVLCTGFSSFPGQAHNPTESLMHFLSKEKYTLEKDLKINLDTHVLQTSWKALNVFFETMPLVQYDAILAFGVAGRSRKIRLETVAKNLTIQSIPDAEGCFATASHIISDMPQKLKVQNPLNHIVDALNHTGLPCRLSRDAGSYLCNAMLYKLLVDKRLENTFKLFVHVPDPERKGHAFKQKDIEAASYALINSVSI